MSWDTVMNDWCRENFLLFFLLYFVWYNFVGMVHALVSLGHKTERVNVCQHFALCYTMQTFLLAYSERGLVLADVRPCSKVWVSYEVIKKLHCTEERLFGSSYCLDNTLLFVWTSRRNLLVFKVTFYFVKCCCCLYHDR